jgi:uncharacterized protein YbjT (DUF2867 family)
MTILVVGGTGTLGRQIVRQALDEGYKVKCMVRDFRRGAFLKEWGAELIYGDLSIPSTIPVALKGSTIVIDSSTVRSTSTYTAESIDWKGKLALLETSKLIGITKYISFSVLNAKSNSDIPLMDLKVQMEEKIKSSGLNYTIFQCSGFFQGLISQYALPILESETIWLQNNAAPVAYLDTQDAANAVVQSLNLITYDQRTVSLIGQKFWTSKEVVNYVNVYVVKPQKFLIYRFYPLVFYNVFLDFLSSHGILLIVYNLVKLLQMLKLSRIQLMHLSGL